MQTPESAESHSESLTITPPLTGQSAPLPDPSGGQWRRRMSGRRYEINSFALAFSVGVTGLLGIAYWALAARLMPDTEVGKASAIISTMTTLGTLANLSIGPMFERFLAVSGGHLRRVIWQAHGVTALLSLLLGAGFVLLGPSERLFAAGWQTWVFPLFVMATAAFALQDSLLVGLLVARYVAVKNILQAVGKIIVLVLVGGAYGGFSITLGWAAITAVVAAGIFAAVVRRWVPEFARTVRDNLPPSRDLWAYFGSQYSITVIGNLPGLLVPLIVLQLLGEAATAYFNLAWVLVVAFFTLIATVSGPFVAEVAAAPEKTIGLLRRFALILSLLCVGAGVVLGFVAPWLLQLLGKAYGSAGGALLEVMAWVMPLMAVTAFYTALARIERRLRLLVVLQCVTAVVQVIATYLLVPHFGLVGVGYANLGIQLLSCLIMIGPMLASLRRVRNGEISL